MGAKEVKERQEDNNKNARDKNNNTSSSTKDNNDSSTTTLTTTAAGSNNNKNSALLAATSTPESTSNQFTPTTNDKDTAAIAHDDDASYSSDDDDDLVTKLADLHVTAATTDKTEAKPEVAIPSKPDLPPISQSLREVAAMIRHGLVRNILVLSGAGVSCSAGIPDFRTPGTGLYDNLEKYDLPYPEAVFDLDFYRSNPRPFLNLAGELWPGRGKYSPTLAHSFVALLHAKHLLLRNYTQNIDGLEILSNVPDERIVECHGHFRTASCIECGSPSTLCRDVILNSISTTRTKSNDNNKDDIPTCQQCGGYVKPDIVFFGEGLPAKFHSLLPQDVDRADLLLVMGTSLKVAPVSYIPNMVSCPRILINRDVIGIGGDFQEDMGDYVYQGDCDVAVQLLARELQWEDELLELHQSTRIAC